MAKSKLPKKEVPADFSKGFQYEDIRVWQPSWKERFFIALGFNVMIGFRANTQHKPGKMAMGIYPQLTAHDAMVLKHMPRLARFFIKPSAELRVKDNVLLEKADTSKELLCIYCGQINPDKIHPDSKNPYHDKCWKDVENEVHAVCSLCKKPITGNVEWERMDQNTAWHTACARNKK